MQRLANFIGGRFEPPLSGTYFDDINPATGEVIAEIPDSGAGDIDHAVAAAREAFATWKRVPAAERSEHVLRLAGLVARNAGELALLESRDSGKTISLAKRLDIPRAEKNLRFFATAILHSADEFHPMDGAAINYTLRQPIGVAGLISPWNLPLYLLTWKIAPAIAAGNTCVAKPSELTPLTAARFAELVAEAGVPPGVINIVHGRGASAGEALTLHPGVPLISFTGGTVTGAAVMRAAGPLFKKVSLELGGKNPNVIFADADLDEAVAGSIRSSFENQGEICLCGSRLFVERRIHDEFLERFTARATGMKVGDPEEPSTEVGALISSAHLQKVAGYVALAREEGGEIATGGSRPANLPERLAGGFFLEPTVITGVDASCRVMQEEIFGPVVTVTPFDGDDEAIALANATRYGLSASIWTRDLRRAHRVAAELESGTVWVNTWLLRDLRVPFGGVKESGVGREGGLDSLRFFTEAKNVCIKLS
ncbi:MAG TPA: aldehyde dehydrogenase [Thermoanaerobaculia bacterium]|nr:aldehyde dehydrogenase [Thermoanaerobaculia bacterium]